MAFKSLCSKESLSVISSCRIVVAGFLALCCLFLMILSKKSASCVEFAEFSISLAAKLSLTLRMCCLRESEQTKAAVRMSFWWVMSLLEKSYLAWPAVDTLMNFTKNDLSLTLLGTMRSIFSG